MKSSPCLFTIAALSLAFVFFATPGRAQFQRVFGTALDESFSKVVQSGANYYVLGNGEMTDGQPGRATVTRLNATGELAWTLSLNIASQWNDAVLTPNGNLLVVGHSLPDDQSTKGIMGLVTPTGAFSWVRDYDLPQKDAFLRIVRNPVPQNAAFPYYVLGTQTDFMTLNTDMVLLNLNESGTFNWKKIFTGPIFFSGSKLPHDLEALPNGNLLIAVNFDLQGLVMRIDNTGAPLNGLTPEGLFTFRDIAPASDGGFFGVGVDLQNEKVHLVKFDADMINLWEVTIQNMTDVSQVWQGLNGDIYVTGARVSSGHYQPCHYRISANGGTPDLVWAKWLDNNILEFTGGTTSFLSPSQLAFTDGRMPASGGFGQFCAFISVSDLDLSTCMTIDGDDQIQVVNPLYNGPLLPDINFYDVPAGNNLTGSFRTWQQANACSEPCTASFDVNYIDNCGHVQVISTSTGLQPFSYQWCSGESTPDLDLQLPCGAHTFCVTVTCADGSMSTATQTIQVSENIPPQAVCAPGFGVTLDPDCTATLTPVMIDGGSTDNCRIESMTVSPSVLTGCGDFPVTLTVTDWCGNVGACTTSVQTLETTPPQIICPPDVQKSCDTDIAPQFTGTATATDNCTSVPLITYSDITLGALPCDGVLQRTWTVADSCGNEASCIQLITVKDLEPPMINCPPDLTVGTDPGQCYFTGNIPMPTATDNCNPNPTVTCYLVTESGLVLITPQTKFPKGDNTICCIADDGCVDVGSLLCEAPCEANRWEGTDGEPTGGPAGLLTTLDVQPGISPQVLVQEGLIGGNCFDVSNITSRGEPSQLGTFTNGFTNVGFPSGVILATGPAILAVGPNDSDTKGIYMGGSSTPDPDLATLTAGTQFDIAGLEFDFIPTAGILTLNYVFASEEYCELAANTLHDVFGIFISGPGIPGGKQNIAVIPSTTTPVGIGTVNHISTSGFYVNNQPAGSANLCGQSAATGPTVNELQYDGFTRKFTAMANVIPGQTYHIKIAIADVGDGLSDSAVFLNAGSFDAGGEASVTWVVNGDPTLHTVYEDCGTVDLVFDVLGPDLNAPLTVNFTVGGTATPGIDYVAIPTSIVIPAGQGGFILPVTILNEGVLEGDETITITLTDACSFQMPQAVLTIRDYLLTQAKCTFTLTVEDQEPPMITCPPNQTVTGVLNADGACTAIANNLTPNLSDNCVMLMLDYTVSGATNGAGVDDASGSLFSAGASTVTYTATDMGGNPASCSFTVTVACSASSDNCCLEWASQVGANSNYWSGFATTADATGNPVIVGTSSTSGASLLFNLFVSRFAPSGALLWTVDIPGFTELELHGVKTDALGNIYVAGGFSGTADFDPGSNVYTLTSTGSRDGFILKLDPSGAFLWAFQLTGVGINLFPELDPSGDLLIAGYTQGSTIDFDPGPGVAPLVFSSLDCFVARYTPSGALVWAKKLSDGTPGSSAFLTAFHADQSGNLYLAGRFSGTVDFDPGPGTYNLTGSAGGDLFVTKLDASGNFLWTDAFPNLTSTFSTITLVSSIAVDVQGSVFLACLFDGGPFDMDPGPGSVILTPIGVLDIVVTKLSSTGAHFWSKQVGAAGATIWVRSAAVDAQGNVYSAGFANGTVDFDPGSGVSLFSSNPGNATFIQKLDNGGNFVWVKQIAQSRSEGVFVDNSGSIFCTGSFIGTTDFDPGPGSYNLTANAANDAYLLKLGTCVPADTCICGAFSDMFIRGPQGAMSRPVLCGGPPLNIGCPAPGVGFTLTGSFMCAGDSCTSSADLDWSLYGPDNNLIASDTASADPWFGFNLPSSVFSQSGVYTLIISGHCGADSCTCNIQFMVEEGCMETCPCDLADLNSDVNQGFATAYAANSCKVCFTPLALSDCDEVEWFVDDPLGTAVGTSTGNQTFCHTFPTGGTYTVYMTVTRKRADGSLCESSAKNQIVTVTCLTRTVCENSLLPNPDFEEGAVAGSLGMEGMSAGWTRVWGDPHINVNGGKKKVRLTGNFDNADVLSTQEAICLQKTTGTISLRCGIKEQGLRSTLNIQFFTGDDYTFGACSSENCFLVARIELPPSDTSEEFDVVIPYDISTWAPAELCGNGSGVMIRPAIFVTNDLGDEQGEDTRTVIDLDYFCLDGMLVGLNGPGKPRSMRLYPNPSAGSFTLELAQAASPATTIRIIGLTGQVVAERRAEIGRMQQRVEAGNLPAGLYFVHLAVEGRTVGVLKWVKQ